MALAFATAMRLGWARLEATGDIDGHAGPDDADDGDCGLA
ncbi:hypothetical protein FB563_3434 [Streptomyces puniciscabiei]|uniref:Uncharacterized protein n=1 Tax=Streptomyces puniciscabiei TaxID=164348 RepID=A0A542UH47_9ACTN|nr:hypothetical protein FB563_3434 [Streptomyces puniciscabiei]